MRRPELDSACTSHRAGPVGVAARPLRQRPRAVTPPSGETVAVADRSCQSRCFLVAATAGCRPAPAVTVAPPDAEPAAECFPDSATLTDTDPVNLTDARAHPVLSEPPAQVLGGTVTQPAWLTVAAKQVGYAEKPGNDNKFGRALGLNRVPWCDLFVTWCCKTSKHPLPSMQPGMETGAASVWYSMRYAQVNGLWRPSWQAQPGDQIVYGWNGPGSAPADMHTGFVVSSGPKGSTGHTIEGNRGDHVGRFTFTVGEPQVLGTIALTKLLGRDRVAIKPKPDPQPRPKHHPSHTGPAPKPAPTPKAKPKKGKPVTTFLTYLKAHVALLGAGVTWALATFPPNSQAYHIITAVTAVLTALGVAVVPNKKAPKP